METKPKLNVPSRAAAPAAEPSAEQPPAAVNETEDNLLNMLVGNTTPAAVMENLPAAEIALANVPEQQPIATARAAEPRRVLQPIESVTPEIDTLMQKRAALEAELQQLDEDLVEKERAAGVFVTYFTSRNHSQVIYVKRQHAEVRCDFRNGLFQTTDQAIVAALMATPMFKRGDIRIQENARLAHLRAKLAGERTLIKQGRQVGVTGSTAGSDAAFQQRDHVLATAERQLL